MTPVSSDGGRIGRGSCRKRVVTALAALAAATAAYAAIEPRLLRRVRYRIDVPGLPREMDGLRIGHLSDFHFGMRGLPLSTIDRAIASLLRERPDLVALTGDVLHDGRWRPEAHRLRRLAEEIPTFAVLGNHDHWGPGGDVGELVRALSADGVTVLRNASAAIDLPGRGRLLVVGVDDPSMGLADLDSALCRAPDSAGEAPALLLAHSPEIAAGLPHDRFSAVLSGHTHGGQIRLSPGTKRSPLEIAMILGKLESDWARGSHVVRGNPLVVSNGLGLSGLPLRLMAPPEVGIVTLRSAPEGARPVIVRE